MLRITGLCCVVLVTCALGTMNSWADTNEGEDVNVHSFKMNSLEGEEVDFAEAYQGKVLLIVNVASRCGYTKHYEGLQELYEQYKDKGLVVLGIPCNQFGRQEPGSAKEIREFCESKFGVTFDMFEKVDVNGEKACELFQYLTSTATEEAKEGKVGWNFEKFLIDAEGNLVARFPTATAPDAKELVEAIEAQLSAIE